MMIGLKDQEKFKRSLRAIKTLFFLITMLISFLILSAPILLVIADAILPCALLSFPLSTSPSFLSLEKLKFYLTHYDFRFSLIDIPIISLVRSTIILCVYCLCDGPRLSRGPYLGITTFCSVISLVFVSVKASYVFRPDSTSNGVGGIEIAMILISIILALGHIIVAYRISCRERRKLLIYKIDIEAISAWQKAGSPTHKILQQKRSK